MALQQFNNRRFYRRHGVEPPSVGVFIMRSVCRLLRAVFYSRFMVKSLSTHLGFFCRINTTAMSWLVRQKRGANILLTHGSLSLARRFATLTRFITTPSSPGRRLPFVEIGQPGIPARAGVRTGVEGAPADFTQADYSRRY